MYIYHWIIGIITFAKVMVFYRKYRSQTIDELDNNSVRTMLHAVLGGKEIPHAFLFTGPKGLGKTSAARIVAKVVNCQNRNQESRVKNQEKDEKNKTNKSLDSSFIIHDSSIEPCNSCDQCNSITNGTNLDVMEIDAASNRGIDEMRDLRDKIRLSPIAAKKKVYIIDEVHMLTTEAFNALLKTLEEPPSHAMFILCTTESHKVPATILSRCFHIPFTLATTEELVRSFKRIATGEKLVIADDVLATIATLSEGGFRDGAKILEELALHARGETITQEFVEVHYKTRKNFDVTERIITAFVKRSTKEGLEIIAQVVNEGSDIKYIFVQLLTKLHATLLHKIGVENIEFSQEALVLSVAELRSLLTLLTKASSEMKYAVVASLPLELALIEWSSRSEENQEVGIKNQEQKKEEISSDTKEESTGISVAGLRKQVGNIAKIKALYGEERKETNETEETKVNGISLLHFSKDGEITKEWMNEFWRCIIAEMKNHNHTIAGVLRGCRIKSFDRKNLVIETAFQFHKEKLDQRKTMDVLERICKSLIGNPVTVTIELKV